MSDLPRGRRLPLLSGASHLAFRCNGCGDCCRMVRVAVTHHDLRRLATGLERSVSSFVDWLPADAVDMTNEPGSFVELREGRRLMVLAQRAGACHLLDANQRCSAYASRPLDCQLYPLDLSRDEAGVVVGVARLDPHGCGDEAGQDADVIALGAEDERRWREIGEYQGHVARWNRLAGHRRRFRRQPGDAGDFFAFLGLASSHPVETEAIGEADSTRGQPTVHAASELGYPK